MTLRLLRVINEQNALDELICRFVSGGVWESVESQFHEAPELFNRPMQNQLNF